MEDDDGIGKIGGGDDDAAQAFVEKYRPRLMRFLAGRGIVPPDADDLVQDVFLAVFPQIREGRFRGESSVFTWVISILNNKVASYRKKQNRRAIEGQMPTEPAGGGEGKEIAVPSEGTISPEGRAILLQILGRLPNQHRVILLLHTTEGLTTDEIARWLRMPAGTVGRKLREAWRMLGELGRREPGGED